MVNSKSGLWKRPGTRLGWWAVGLVIAFILMMIFNAFAIEKLPEDVFWRQVFWPIFSIVMMASAVAGLVVGLIAIIGKKERSWVVWLALIPGVLVLFFLFGEFLFPH